MQYLNTNHVLYDAVRKAEQEGNLLMDEAQRAARYLRVDFERGGIHLSAGMLFSWFLWVTTTAVTSEIFSFRKLLLFFFCFADKLDRVNQLNIEISQLCRE